MILECELIGLVYIGVTDGVAFVDTIVGTTGCLIASTFAIFIGQSIFFSAIYAHTQFFLCQISVLTKTSSDGIARIYGLNNIQAEELVEFASVPRYGFELGSRPSRCSLVRFRD